MAVKKYGYWIDSGKYSMVQKIIVLVFGVLTFMMLARELLPQVLGVWGLFLITSGIIETARNALIRNAYIVFINKSEVEDHPGVEHASLATNIIFTLVTIAVLFFGGRFFENALNAPGLALVFNIYCCSLILLIPFSSLEIRLTAKADFKGVLVLYFFRNGFLLLAVAVYYFMSAQITLAELSFAYLLSLVVGLISGLIYDRKTQKSLRVYSKDILVKYLNYGKFVLGNNLGSLIFRNTDSFLTSSFISSAASAYYSTCTRIANFSDMPSQVLGDIMFPKASKIVKDGKDEEIKGLYEKTVAATLTFTIPVILMVLVFAKPIVYIMAGTKYYPAIPLLRVIILYGLFLPFIRQFGNVMDVTGRPHVNFLTMAVFAAINIGVNILSIHYFGLFGSAYGTLFSYFLLFCTSMILLHHYLGVRFSRILFHIKELYPEYWKLAINYSKTAFRNL